MQNIVIGTAGHIDHGKTCLIKALTGTDTDRLKEEKKRGITIELGFAKLESGDADTNIGIIDVPGHEKFIKNMLAGIGGIDFVLLVIAADEGIMPQTREHMDILKLLDIQQGFVVLTKCDQCEEDWLELVKEEISEYLSGSFLEHAPIFQVSSHTGYGIDTLRAEILKMVKTLPAHDNDPDKFRLPIDRVFTMKGHGTVVTGTLIEGSCKVDDEAVLMPAGIPARIRSIQVYGKDAPQAFAGQRTALNLTVKTEVIDRGFVAAKPGSMIKTFMVDVRLHLLEHTERKVVNNSRVHFYYGSDEAIGKVVLFDREELLPGETAYVQIRFEREIALKRRDYFAIRFYSPLETIGGGIVLDASPRRHKRSQKTVLESMQIKDTGTKEEAAEKFLEEESQVFPDTSLLALKTNFSVSETTSLLKKLKGTGRVLEIGKNIFIHKTFFDGIVPFITDTLKAFHKSNALTEGLSKEELKSRLTQKLYGAEAKSIDVFYDYLIEKKVIKEKEGLTSLYSFTPKQNSDNKQEVQNILSLYKEAGFAMPKTDDTINKSKNAKTTRQLLEKLVKDGELIKITPAYYMHRECYENALELLKDFIQKNGSITLADFRTLMNSSRKYTQMILEYFDSRHITKLADDRRTLL
ncbi:MAG: selenocysteine-specific translation elongation factor [Lachnospiraceae bacterium]|nr:selenocysteine-specific translation elongation factor [Lachnospiraceae bacterium]